ncbi:hypothetical protein BO85DRAFT_509998, partial [Aspergillus piperis CBS 112811]
MWRNHQIHQFSFWCRFWLSHRPSTSEGIPHPRNFLFARLPRVLFSSFNLFPPSYQFFLNRVFFWVPFFLSWVRGRVVFDSIALVLVS